MNEYNIYQLFHILAFLEGMVVASTFDIGIMIGSDLWWLRKTLVQRDFVFESSKCTRFIKDQINVYRLDYWHIYSFMVRKDMYVCMYVH